MSRSLGSNGLVVGPIAYGCFRFAGTDVATGRAKIEAAVAAGMTLIDTADIYGLDGPGFGAAEELLGRVLAEAPGLRDEIVLATKGGIVPGVPYDSSRLADACDESLGRLGVDVIDLYQIHRPDLLAHPAEVGATLDRLRAEGKVREVGVSNFSTSQVDALRAHLDAPLVTTQPQLSLAHLDPIDDGVLDQCMELGLVPLAWSPLGGGRLVGDDAEGPVVDELDRIAAEHGTHRSAVALAFLLAHPAGVVPIVGTQTIERIAAAGDALDVDLSRAERYRLIAATGRALP